MTIIIYKKLLNQYRISKIHNADSSEITLKFEEPIEAKLFIENAAFDVSGGIVKIPRDILQGGEAVPKLYTDTGKEEIEPFVISGKTITRVCQDSEYLLFLAQSVTAISKRLDECESTLLEINRRLDGKLRF